MAHSRSRMRDWLEYFTVRTLSWVVETLPQDWAMALVRGMSRLACRLDRRHRQVAFDNLRHAFPGRYNDDQLRAMVREVYEHFGLFLLELPLMYRKLHRHNWREFAPVNELHRLHEARQTGRPVILTSAHLGNWEMAAYLIALSGVKMDIVTRPLDNPHLQHLARRFRMRHGHDVLNKHGDLDQMRRVLSECGTLCTVGDQDAGPRGLFVNFFGRPASASKAIAHLSRRYNALIVVLLASRQGGLMNCAVRIPDVIDPQEYDGSPDAAQLITQRLTDSIERVVREFPLQYLWLHRLWKHTPPASKQTLAAKQSPAPSSTTQAAA